MKQQDVDRIIKHVNELDEARHNSSLSLKCYDDVKSKYEELKLDVERQLQLVEKDLRDVARLESELEALIRWVVA